MARLFILLGLSWRSRLRGLISAGGSSLFVILGGAFYFVLACALGVGAYIALSQGRGGRVERVADIASLAVTFLRIFFVTRPLILANLSGASLQHLLHLPIRRRELLLYSLLTGVVTPLLLESPALIGAALGAATHPGLILITLPLALLCHLTLLAGSHAMSLFAVLIARKTWISDLARVLAFSVFFLPSLLNYRGAREFFRPWMAPIAQLSPLGWAARSTVYAGAGEYKLSLAYAAPAVLLLLGIAVLSMTFLNRILAGEGSDRVTKARTSPRPARIFLPTAVGALVETQLRTQLRTPAARMALLMPTLMMGLFALSLSRRGQAPGSAFAMVLFLSLIAGNTFAVTGRGIALILGTPVSRAAILLASDISGIVFRLPPLLAILAVTAWRAGGAEALSLAAFALSVIPVSLGVQHFVATLRPFALPRDRLNPYAQRADSRQSTNGVVSLLATLVTAFIASPFLFLLWLSSRVDDGGRWLVALSCLGALATYAVLIALAERLFLRRELRVLEVLLDDTPG